MNAALSFPAPTSRDLLGLRPGSRVTARGKEWVLIGNPWVECTGAPGIHRVRMNVLPLEGIIAEWVAARGWRKTKDYFRCKTLRGAEITAITYETIRR